MSTTPQPATPVGSQPVPPTTVPNPQPAEGTILPAEGVVKDTTEVAKEVLAGRWGRGQNRRQRLSDAGHNVDDVLAEVKKLMNKQ